MTSMPKITDRMVVEFRRTGRRRASYRSAQAGRARVVLQRSGGCRREGDPCRCNPVTGFCAGFCDARLDCINDPFVGGDPHRL